MDTMALATIAAAVFLWGLTSARLERADVTGPIVFALVGYLLVETGLVSGAAEPETILPLVETALVWVLFSDAARVPLRDLRADAGRCVRLLALGLPLTVVAGWVLAAWLLPGLGGWLALLVGAALAPTDAALGASVVTNPAVPARVRRLITVESGLNDGIVTPVVFVALAGAVSAEGLADAPGPAAALLDLADRGSGGRAPWARWAAGCCGRRGAGGGQPRSSPASPSSAWPPPHMRRLSSPQGNGFVAAFCGGLTFGATAGRRGPAELAFTEQAGSLLGLIVWLTFGAIAVPVLLDHAGWTTLLYAVLSLSVVRMVPVAVATLGASMDARTVLFVGWFGPRGLASLVFALITLEELGPAADDAVAVITGTVLLSVVVHGISAAPLAARYGRSAATRERVVTPRG